MRIPFRPPALVLLAWLSASLLMAPPPALALTIGSGKPATEKRAVADFQAIAVNGSIDIQVRQGGTESVEVRADDNVLPLIETLVEDRTEGRTLVVRYRRGESVSTRSPVKVTIGVVKLSSLAMSGSGNAQVEALNTPALKLAIAGSSDVALRALATESLQISIAGSGDVRADGSARLLRLSIAGSGDAALTGLVAEEVRLSVAGSGNAKVHATKALEVSVAGSGDVEYTGNPAAVKSRVAGSGEVRKR